MLVYQVYVHPVGREVQAEDVEVGAWVWEVDGFGYPSRPHRSLPLGPERLGGLSRECRAARSMEGQPQEAGMVSRYATRIALAAGVHGLWSRSRSDL